VINKSYLYLQETEKTLDIFNITLARQQAEVEVSFLIWWVVYSSCICVHEFYQTEVVGTHFLLCIWLCWSCSPENILNQTLQGSRKKKMNFFSNLSLVLRKK